MAELLADTTRWVEAYVPVRQPANVRGVYVASVYGRPGESSEDIFEGALTVAAGRGLVPYLICGDYNMDIADSPA
eukprot:8964548-Alexandrium_andersonii.AAC.1